MDWSVVTKVDASYVRLAESARRPRTGRRTPDMHAYNVVVTQFMGRSLFAEICVDGVPRRRLVGVERFRTAPVSAEDLTDEVRVVMNERVRNAARKHYLCPADIIWLSAPSP